MDKTAQWMRWPCSRRIHWRIFGHFEVPDITADVSLKSGLPERIPDAVTNPRFGSGGAEVIKILYRSDECQTSWLMQTKTLYLYRLSSPDNKNNKEHYNTLDNLMKNTMK
ncbi:hypothetical protein AVEN_168807-1 [Araneus ventricosus]|uniref:Uncharacterized protein n=1 Tax=Araneus ventricosus TaxID=182803 RepID=A0A4Y2RGD2_ARAVE|nr:hypothetical protein AVEN_168807-1 [Araneus ventricosus]